MNHLLLGRYDLLIIAPATANTVAKIAHGIADTLVTNAVAQTAKGGTPIYILPVDLKRGKYITITPDGNELELRIREIDAKNAHKLSEMENVHVIKKPKEIYEMLGMKEED